MYCSLYEKCIAPGKEDIEALKIDWESYEKVRMARIESEQDPDSRRDHILLKNDRYRTWVNSSDFENITKEMVSIKRKYFLKKITIGE